MLAPLLTIVLSVALGAALGILPGALPRITSPIRTFAVVAGTAVVALHFLPHVLASKGLWGLLVAAASFTFVLGLERLAVHGRPDHGDSGVGIGLGFTALLIHRLGDGAAMAASSHGPGVLWALGAHAVPIVALVTLAYRRRSLASALWRAAALGAASLCSFFLVQSLPVMTADGFHPYIDAAAAGILINVVLNELRGDSPRKTRERFVDLGAGAAGLALVLAPASGAQHDELSLVDRFVDLSIHTAPMLLIGLAGGALLQALGPRLPDRWLSPRSPFIDALRGTIYGAPLPLCSCSVLPLSRTLKRGGAGPALVVAFLIATPELGLETLTLSVRLLGWPFALFRLAGALMVAFIAGMTVASLAPRSEPAGVVRAPFGRDGNGASTFRRFIDALDDLFLHVGGWIVLGLLAAAYADALIPQGGLENAGSPLLQLVIVTAVAVPSYVCAPSATPLAAALVAKGLAPGTVLVGLLLGPATNVATLLFLRKSFGLRALVGMLGSVIVCSWLLGLCANAVLAPTATTPSTASHDGGVFELTGLALLLVVLARTVWSAGIRGWLAASLTDGDDSPHTEHGHSHGHGGSHHPAAHAP
jgi:uncharacterized membrane protein YraQ (UPF0718 family)